jgi:hypothetical protein
LVGIEAYLVIRVCFGEIRYDMRDHAIGVVR